MTEDTTTKKKTKPYIDARPVLERLAQFHPQLFGARFLPLKVGIFNDLLAAHPDAFTRDELKSALAMHARSTRYLDAVAAGEKRHDMDGNPVEDIAPEHVHHAIMEVFRRRQAKSKEDLKPWLMSRLVSAIERSGLARDEYMERVRAEGDEALSAAFSEIGARAAKRDAVRRAYEGSGRSAAEFAEMYGIDPGELEHLLK